jgi:hypothetical protein
MTLNLEAIKARCEKATAGPWIPFTPSGVHIPSIRRSREACEPSQWYVIAKFGNVDATDDLRQEQTNNRDFCLHARTDLPALVAEVERLRKDDVVKWAWVEAVQDELAAKNAELARMESALAAARAALDGEREQRGPKSGDHVHHRLAGITGVVVATPRVSVKWDHDGSEGEHFPENLTIVARRAAEAKASRGGDHVADAGQMVAAAQEPKP